MPYYQAMKHMERVVGKKLSWSVRELQVTHDGTLNMKTYRK